MTAILNELKHIDADASDRVRRIRDLKGLSDEFISALQRAELSLDQHLCLIESEEIALGDLRARAVELAAFIGADGIEDVIDHDTGREPVDEPAAECGEVELTGFIMVDAASEVIDPPQALTAEEITEAVATIADEPLAADASDEPEMDHDDVERAEETLNPNLAYA